MLLTNEVEEEGCAITGDIGGGGGSIAGPDGLVHGDLWDGREGGHGKHGDVLGRLPTIG